jgi:hypothetical protein
MFYDSEERVCKRKPNGYHPKLCQWDDHDSPPPKPGLLRRPALGQEPGTGPGSLLLPCCGVPCGFSRIRHHLSCPLRPSPQLLEVLGPKHLSQGYMRVRTPVSTHPPMTIVAFLRPPSQRIDPGSVALRMICACCCQGPKMSCPCRRNIPQIMSTIPSCQALSAEGVSH